VPFYESAFRSWFWALEFYPGLLAVSRGQLPRSTDEDEQAVVSVLSSAPFSLRVHDHMRFILWEVRSE
jgi:hypothetical protein